MWARIVAAAAGVWLMAAPHVLGTQPPARTVDRVIGPLVAAAAVIAMSEVTRPVRRLNLLLGLALLAAPWLLGYGTAATINSTVVGMVVAAASLVRGPLHHRLGGGWSSLWTGRATPPHEPRLTGRAAS
jgi:hypothetical protein